MRLLRYTFLLLVVFVWGCEDDEVKSNLALLHSFAIEELPNLEFTISDDNRVETLANDGTNLNSLTAVFTISDKAAMYIGAQRQGSGATMQNFTETLTYRVEAEDGTTNEYLVSIYTDLVIKQFNIVEWPNVIFTINDNKITATVPFGTSLNNLTAQFTISDGAKLYMDGVEQITEVTNNDFSQDITYVIKSGDNPEKEYTVVITVADNQAPVANAGEDKTVYIASGESTKQVQLDGSASTDPDNNIASYHWSLQGSDIASIDKPIVALSEGTHTLTLTVTDSEGLFHTDDVVINVLKAGNYVPVDADATQSTKNLLQNLGNIANSEQFIFGQEFPMSFQLGGLRSDLSTSDCYEVSGDHPGVFGIDPHYMLYKSESQKQLHIDEAKKAYQNGAVVTFDFHQQSKVDHKIYMNDITTATDKSLMYDVVNDLNDARQWFYGELDQIIGFINNDLGFPVVFRLYHEMDGDWFWWGSKATNHSTDLYIDFYRLSVDYIKERTNLVLFAWSPNYQLNESYYPGDNYVDIVGIDIYEPSASVLKNNLINLSSFAFEHNKVAALTETGYRNDFVQNKPEFWRDIVLEAILQGGSDIRIAWALAWFNAPWHNNQSDLIIPNANSPQNARDYFIEFKNAESTLFMEEVKVLNMYN